MRFNALSRSIESALQKEAIPSKVLAGHKFFERLEVRTLFLRQAMRVTSPQIKDLLSYLQLVDNSEYQPAFTRAINVPGRGIGEKVCLN